MDGQRRKLLEATSIALLPAVADCSERPGGSEDGLTPAETSSTPASTTTTAPPETETQSDATTTTSTDSDTRPGQKRTLRGWID